MTLDEWLLDKRMIKNSLYINYPGCRSLYVRKTPVYINGVRIVDVITIANITAEESGTHVLRRLIEDIKNRGYKIYVECVNNPWLREKLIQYGFKQVNKVLGFHFYLGD